MSALETPLSITGKETRPVLRGTIPGERTRRIVSDDARFLATTTKTSPIAGRIGRGAVVLDEDGNVLLDFTSGIGVTNTGHSHPVVVKAIQEQAARMLHFAGTDFYYEVQVDVARELASLVPGAFQKRTFFVNSGTEANEAAIKLVRWSSRRPLFFAFAHAFHGRTMGSLGLSSSKTVHKERFFPMMPGVHTVPFPNPYRNPLGIDGYADPKGLTSAILGLLEDKLDGEAPPSEVGAFFVEPIQGEGGYVVPPMDFYRGLKALLDKHGILLVADEVQTGFGRTGTWFAMEHFGVAASITTMAKGMGSGLPIGAAVFDARLDFGVSGAHSNTYGGNMVAAAAARATIAAIRDERLLEQAQRTGAHLGQRLRELQSKDAHIGDVRGLGLMWALDLVKDPRTKSPDKERRDRIVEAAWKRGLLLLPCGKSAIRVIPPLVVSEGQIDGAMEVLALALKDAS